jgi:hypothetical protein
MHLVPGLSRDWHSVQILMHLRNYTEPLHQVREGLQQGAGC